MDKVNCAYDNDLGFRFDGIRTDRVNVLGCKLLVGEIFDLYQNKYVSLNFCPYFGIGFRYTFYQYEIFEGTVNDKFYSYLKVNDEDWYITPQIGFMCGVGFRH